MLADSLRLEGETEVHWTPPKVGNPAAVKRVVEELDRGLKPARPIYLKWICDKLSALPTQTVGGVNAAFWTDNVVDVCSHYPEDLLQAATLDLLRAKTFRPSPAEIVAVIEPRYLERQRMLSRARSLLAPDGKPGERHYARRSTEEILAELREHNRNWPRMDAALAAPPQRAAPPIERPAKPPGSWKAGMPVFDKPMPSAASEEPPMPDEIPE